MYNLSKKKNCWSSKTNHEDDNDNNTMTMGVSKNRDTPKSSILIGFSIINHPFWGTLTIGNTHIVMICTIDMFSSQPHPARTLGSQSGAPPNIHALGVA